MNLYTDSEWYNNPGLAGLGQDAEYPTLRTPEPPVLPQRTYNDYGEGQLAPDSNWQSIGPVEAWKHAGLQLSRLAGMYPWLSGERTGVPNSAPGPLQEILPALLGFVDPAMAGSKLAAAPRTLLGDLPGIISASYKARKALAESVPEYSAVVEGLGGVGQNAWRMIKEQASKIRNMVPEMTPEMEGAVLTPRGQRGLSAGYDRRFDGAEFGKKRTGPSTEWEDLGPGTNPGERIYGNPTTRDVVYVNADGKVDTHLSKRYRDWLKNEGPGPQHGFDWMSKYAPSDINPSLSTPTTAEVHRPFLLNLLGKYGVHIPSVPKDITEPLVLKTPYGTVNKLADQVFRKPLATDAAGLFDSLWRYGPGDFSPAINQQFMKRGISPAGDVMLASTPHQEIVLPHENTHLWQDLVTAYLSKGRRPGWQELEAQAKYFFPIRNKVLTRRPWVPLSERRMDIPSTAYIDQAEQAWEALPRDAKSRMTTLWPNERAGNQRLNNELVAEMATPEMFGDAMAPFPARTYYNSVMEHLPAVRRMIETANEHINPAWYQTPEDLTNAWQRYWMRSGLKGLTNQ